MLSPMGFGTAMLGFAMLVAFAVALAFAVGRNHDRH